MILVFGSINLDIIHSLDALPTPGQTVIGRDLRTEPGGKGANQAVAAARDGAAVAMAGAVGRDAAAEAALSGLRAAGVDLSRLATVDAATGIASICVDQVGQNQIAVGSGANLHARADQVVDGDLRADTILLLQGEVDPAETAALIRRARQLGCRVILNLAPPMPLDRDLFGMLDWLVVNGDEAEWLSKRLGTGPGAAALHASLGVGVIRTGGERGLEAAMAGGAVTLAALRVVPVDTTGAGDCFVGVFAAALDCGAKPEHAMRRANAAAGLSCTRRGSQGSFPSREEIDALAKRMPSPSGEGRGERPDAHSFG